MGRAFKERSGKVAFGYGDTGGTKHTASSAVVRADGKPGVGMPGGESWTSNWLTFDNSYFKSVGCTFSPRPTNSFFRLRPAPLFSLRRRTTSSSCGCQRTWRSPRTQAFGRTTSAMLHRRRHSSRTTRRRTRSCPSWGPLSIPQAACASDSDHRQTPAATTTTTTTADDGTRKNHDAIAVGSRGVTLVLRATDSGTAAATSVPPPPPPPPPTRTTTPRRASS